MCGSGLEAIIQGSRLLQARESRLVLAGGMESMSNAPYLLPGARSGLRLGNAEVVDSRVHAGLLDVYNQTHMGSCAELCARHDAFRRDQLDEVAVRSYARPPRA